MPRCETVPIKIEPCFTGSSATNALAGGALWLPVATGRGMDAKLGTGGPLVRVGGWFLSFGRFIPFAASLFRLLHVSDKNMMYVMLVACRALNLRFKTKTLVDKDCQKACICSVTRSSIGGHCAEQACRRTAFHLPVPRPLALPVASRF
jgi:hypothetical protein